MTEAMKENRLLWERSGKRHITGEEARVGYPKEELHRLIAAETEGASQAHWVEMLQAEGPGSTEGLGWETRRRQSGEP